MQEEISLTPTSYVVLGLIELCGEATPYELKRLAGETVGNFWSVPHSALYAEPDRLAAAGHLAREQEEGGLRRKRYAMTDRGRDALAAWRATASARLPELRDDALLKLFFGADPADFAAAQRDAHHEKLAAYERQAREDTGAGPRGPWRVLRAGIQHEREWVRFWGELAGGREP